MLTFTTCKTLLCPLLFFWALKRVIAICRVVCGFGAHTWPPVVTWGQGLYKKEEQSQDGCGEPFRVQSRAQE